MNAMKSLSAALAFASALAAVPALAQDAGAKPHVPLEKSIGQVTPTGPVPSLFVLNSDGASLADGKLTLTGVNPNAIVFADRPVRAAGHVMTAQFVQQWDEDKDNFAYDPPNATISVLGGEGSDVEDAVITLTKPVLDGTTLTFEVAVLEGGLSKSGPAALFIDPRGFGGFHGSAAQISGPRGGSIDVAHAGGGGGYWHAPDYHGAWYGAGAVAAGAFAGAAIGSAVANSAAYPAYAYPPYCGYAPYPPCY